MSARLQRWIGVTFTLAAIFLLTAAGCRTKTEDDGKPGAKVEPKKDNNGKTIPGKTVAHARVGELLPFEKAVIIDPAPLGELRPPDVSSNGKNVAKIFEQIANVEWDRTNFKDDAGKPIRYQAVLSTELGDVHVDLYGHVAPNHVRSFVSLARTGYYDGMKFYYTFNREVDGSKVSYIETGCPKGTGEDGYGSVGYWLRPEFSKEVTHEAGTIGACLRESDDTGAARFYITSVALPDLDGRFTAFGKVIKGLDVVQAINTRPADEMDRPREPVTIRSVRIVAIAE